MAQKLYDEEKIRAIAEKIREKTGSTTTYTTAEMPDGIEAVRTIGHQQGYNFGYQEGSGIGYADGYNDGYVDCKDEFMGKIMDYDFTYSAGVLTLYVVNYNTQYSLQLDYWIGVHGNSAGEGTMTIPPDSSTAKDLEDDYFDVSSDEFDIEIRNVKFV